VSAVEHPAVDAPTRWLKSQGWSRAELAVDGTGRVDLDAAAKTLAEPAGIISVILAQNETGVIQPVAELATMARAADSAVVVHTDAAQAVGKIDVDVETLGVDLLTIVSHKLYGPCGIGALWVRPGVSIEPLVRGGGQERGLRPGTEPVALVVGLGAACRLALADLREEAERQRQLRELLWARLHDGVLGVRRTAKGVATLPNTLHVRFPGKSGAEVLAAAPELAASTGSACHADDDAASGVLGAMGLDAADAAGAVRLSLGRSITAEDVKVAADALVRAATQK
jgi:cysteine desulfurase